MRGVLRSLMVGFGVSTLLLLPLAHGAQTGVDSLEEAKRLLLAEFSGNLQAKWRPSRATPPVPRPWRGWAREHYLGVSTDEELAALRNRAEELGEAARGEFERRVGLAEAATELARDGYVDAGMTLFAERWDAFLVEHQGEDLGPAARIVHLFESEAREIRRYTQEDPPRPTFDGPAAEAGWIEAWADGVPPDVIGAGSWLDPGYDPEAIAIAVPIPDVRVETDGILDPADAHRRLGTERLAGSGLWGGGIIDDIRTGLKGATEQITAIRIDPDHLTALTQGDATTVKRDDEGDPAPHPWKPGDPITWGSDNEAENPGIDTTPEEEVEVVRGATVGHIAQANKRELAAGNRGMGLWGDTGVVQAVIDFQKARNLDLMAKYDYSWDPNKVDPTDEIYIPTKEWVDDWYRRKTGES